MSTGQLLPGSSFDSQVTAAVIEVSYHTKSTYEADVIFVEEDTWRAGLEGLRMRQVHGGLMRMPEDLDVSQWLAKVCHPSLLAC